MVLLSIALNKFEDIFPNLTNKQVDRASEAGSVRAHAHWWAGCRHLLWCQRIPWQTGPLQDHWVREGFLGAHPSHPDWTFGPDCQGWNPHRGLWQGPEQGRHRLHGHLLLNIKIILSLLNFPLDNILNIQAFCFLLK